MIQAFWSAGFIVCFLLLQFKSFLQSGLFGTLLPERRGVRANAPVHLFLYLLHGVSTKQMKMLLMLSNLAHRR